MIIESGIIIFMGLLLLALKLPTRISLMLLGHPLAVDLSASILAYIMHMGTFSGVMAAAVAGLMTSAFTSMARRLFGYISKNTYYPGLIKIDITKEKAHG